MADNPGFCCEKKGIIVRFIDLTNGGIAVCDDEDYGFVSKWKWCRQDNGGGLSYAYRTTTDKPRGMHQFIAGSDKGTCAGKTLQVHHIDGNGLNNCKSNLRITLPGQHQAAHLTGKGSEGIGCEIF